MAALGKISKYDLLEKLSETAFAIVYKARDPFARRLVAIKICVAEDPSLRNAFLRQAEGIAGLFHPNIARILEFGSGDGKPYLVEQFLEGTDLRERIRKGGEVNLGEELGLLVQIAHGLQYAHSKGVLHLDLKPATVHLETGGTVKLVDFGIARMGSAALRLTSPDGIRPPRGYLPPEQALGLPADPRTDIFCFGALAYELLARSSPFTGMSPAELLQESLDETFQSLPRRWPDCPPELAALVNRAMQRSPADRYSDFDELLDDLEPILDSVRLATGKRRDGDASWSGDDDGSATQAPPSLDATMAIPPDTGEHKAKKKAAGQADTGRADGGKAGKGPEHEEVITAYILDPTAPPPVDAPPARQRRTDLEATRITPPPGPLVEKKAARPSDLAAQALEEDESEVAPPPLPPAPASGSLPHLPPLPPLPRPAPSEPAQAEAAEATGDTTGGSLGASRPGRAADSTGSTTGTLGSGTGTGTGAQTGTGNGTGTDTNATVNTTLGSRGTATGMTAGRRKTLLLAGAAAAGLLLVVLAVVLLVGGGDSGEQRLPARERVEAPARPAVPPAPAGDSSELLIDALPWGEVVRVLDQDGREVPLPPNAFTPLRLQVPPGVYQINIRRGDEEGGAGGEEATGNGERSPEERAPSCSVIVPAGSSGECRVELSPVSTTDYLKETRWWR